ncbi:MAG: hypothetical protein M0R06_00390 [Sphaerochaeta sp.]|jgi:tRNA G26 N,N-dimethylase Trm1|nr:hypothetical protein [Sphaerochaeta sp.]
MSKMNEYSMLDEMCHRCLALSVGHACNGVEPGEECLGSGPVYPDDMVNELIAERAADEFDRQQAELAEETQREEELEWLEQQLDEQEN